MIRQSTRWFREFIEGHLDEAARTKMKRVYGVAERLTFLLRNLLKFFSKTQNFWGIFASGRVAIADSKRRSRRGSHGRVTSAACGLSTQAAPTRYIEPSQRGSASGT
jgi:hypothetical protein